MRFSIHDFSQQVAVEMIDTVEVKGKKKTVCIDAADLLILDWFTKFYPNMEKKIIDGKEYGWIKRSKVIADLPILRINEESVSDRLRKLVHFKLLDYRVVKERGTSCYYTYGEKFSTLVSTDEAEQTGSNRSTRRVQTGVGRRVQTGNKDSNGVNDSNLRYKGGEGKSKSADHATSHDAKLCPKCGQSHLFRNRQMARWECGNCFYAET